MSGVFVIIKVMGYQVLYRTYRPKKFSEVVGQEYIIKTLQNAIKINKVAHAYLFAGPRGCGKTSVAKLFAKAINCENYNGEACDECNSCLTYNESNHPDIIEMDAASKSRVEDIREILDEVPYAPLIGKYKVYIIDEVHMLSTSAFNALLKTLEEPPSHVIFILATTDPQKVIPTVLSRCQRYNFSKINSVDMVNKMKEILDKENIVYEDAALKEVATLADGGMRDALSILEQILSYNNEGVTLKDVENIFGLSTTEEKVNLLINTHTQNSEVVISKLRQMYQSGIDMKRLAIDLLDIVKETLIYSDSGSDKLLTKINGAQAQSIFNVARVNKLLDDAKALEECLNTHGNQNFLSYLELCLIKMAASNGLQEENKPVNVRRHAPITPPKKEEVIKEEVKVLEEIKPQVEEKVEEVITEEIKEVIETHINQVNSDNLQIVNVDFLTKVLVSCSKDNKINDAVIYNRLELYKYEPDNRKFYELLSGTEMFASSNDAIIIVASPSKVTSINEREVNEEIYNFIVKEFGIEKMVFAIDDDTRNSLIKSYREMMASGHPETVVVKKYEVKKELTTEERLRDMFGDIRVE